MAQLVSFKRTVNASPLETYRAFTHTTALRDWLCDAAQADTVGRDAGAPGVISLRGHGHRSEAAPAAPPVVQVH